jgi:predicted ATPase/DNA-binding winged helix-turn-helix (wHTH) protein
VETSYKFGPVEVRPANRLLLVDGHPTPVGARAFDVLIALIDRRGRLVTKNELLDIAWPGLVVEENNLQVQISTLRKHLGAHAVVTIPGLGYRFALEPEAAPDAAPRHNLPAQLNRFIGREREIAEIKALAASNRLVNVTSLGGTGKTRLSLQVARELLPHFEHGVWLVELAPISEDSRVAQAVGTVLGVRDQGEGMAAALARWSRDRHVLLVLDNCEHVLQGCAELAKQLLQAGPGVHLFASSREPLHVLGEALYPLSPLPVPDARYPIAPEMLQQYDSVALFIERATAASTAFRFGNANAEAVASICEQVDGIPLAIELAAARVRAMSVERIAAQLVDRFRLLTSGDRTAPARQRTLRDSLDWSYDLLSPPERTLLRRLSIFAGGWTLEAAEAVCAGGELQADDVVEVLAHLVEKSLVDIDAFGERYRLLNTVREYAAEKLHASGEAQLVQGRHFDFFLALVRGTRSLIEGNPEQARWLKRLDHELENVLAAHAAADGAGAQRLLTAIRHYCVNRGLTALAHRLACDTLPRLSQRDHVMCDAYFDAGQLTLFIGRHDEARRHLEESLAIAHEIGARDREAYALQPLGLACLSLGDLAAARVHLEKAVTMARDHGLEREIAAALIALANVCRLEADPDAAAALYDEALACARRVHDRETIAIIMLNLAVVAHRQPIVERAGLVRDALDIADELGSRYVGQIALDVCAGLSAMAGDHESSARFLGAAEALAARTGLHRDAADDAFVAPLVHQAREACAPQRFAAMQAAGGALPYDVAVTEARAWLAKLSS